MSATDIVHPVKRSDAIALGEQFRLQGRDTTRRAILAGAAMLPAAEVDPDAAIVVPRIKG